MDYFVIGEDGQEYGPANILTLVNWVKEGRVNTGTKLKEFQSGVIVNAGSLRELFPPAASAPPLARPPLSTNQYATAPTPYPRTDSPRGRAAADPGTSDVWWAIGRSVLAVGLAVLIPTAGIITAAYSIFYAIRAYQAGHRLGLVAIIISAIALVIVIGLFLLRRAVPYSGDSSRSMTP